MSGIAALLLELGHDVSGSDKVTTPRDASAGRLGLRFCDRIAPRTCRTRELIIYSSAIKPDNPNSC